MLDLQRIDKDWTLFLDRDGIINVEKEDGYILHWGEFEFYQGVEEAVSVFSKLFNVIVMATNQRGVGKGLMTVDDLNDIHLKMLQQLEKSGGRIDQIYCCISLDDNDPMRKPNPGMAFEAKKDFPAIDFSKSIMVGNNISDMEFGRNAGMKTIFVRTTKPEITLPHPAIDFIVDSLSDLAKALQKS
ncbi:MAG: phosphatase [Bacteroidetes bacterium]|nr:MAG: phosphatase [Bacteroidota bacterium]